jgi:hypothetical protein
MFCAAKGTSAAAGGAKVTPDDSWAADGMELAKLKSDIPYDAMKAGAVTGIDVSSMGVDCREVTLLLLGARQCFELLCSALHMCGGCGKLHCCLPD